MGGEEGEGSYNLPACGNRGGKDNASGIHGLKDPREIDTSSDLLNQDGGQPFGSEFLVDAQKVNLHHSLLAV